MKPWLKVLKNVGLLPLRNRKVKVGVTPAEVVYSENKWRLLRYRARPEGLAHPRPIVLVPSLINRHYVLDLMPDKSFTQHLVNEGYDVFTIDWGTPGDEDRFLTFDEVVDRYLGRALKRAGRHSPDGRVHALGYCMGGTLVAIHAALHPERLASFVALAAPIRFADGGMLTAWTRTKAFDVDTLVEACGTVPWPLMQSSFHMLRPTLGLSKAVSIVDRAWNDEFLDGFLALERWGNDNVSMAGELAKKYVKALYREDALALGTLVVSGERVALDKVTCPLLVVSFEHDNIVPAPSATVLLELAGSKDKRHLHLQGGHVGAVVSKHAKKTLWPQLGAFFDGVDAASEAALAGAEVVREAWASAGSTKPRARKRTVR